MLLAECHRSHQPMTSQKRVISQADRATAHHRFLDCLCMHDVAAKRMIAGTKIYGRPSHQLFRLYVGQLGKLCNFFGVTIDDPGKG